MKKIFYTLSLLAIVTVKLSAQSFTAGNLAVLRIGDSTTTLANTGNTLAIDQFTTSGSYVNSIILPKSGTNAVILGATATSEGMLTLATNSSSINFIAYKTTAPYSAAINTSTSATINRVVVSVNAAGAVSFPTLTATNFSAGNPRCVVSNGASYWAAGSNTGLCWGNATSNLDTIVSSSSTNIRVVNIFGGQIYYTTGSGTTGIWRSQAGTPTNSGNVFAPYITTTGTGTGTVSPYGFALNNDSNICYVADDRSVATGGGVQKWIRTGSVWSLAYTLATGTGSTVGARALTVNWNTTPATIIAITAESSLNRVIRINDTSSTVTAVTLATAVANTIFRGVSYTPGTSALPVNLTGFTASKLNNDITLNWNTASEINNDKFVIERSIDNNIFESIGEVKGAGNSGKTLTYSFVDESIGGIKILYYRLKQVDVDGNFTYSKTVCVIVDINNQIITTPNPFTNDITIHIDAKNNSNAIVEVVDLLGKVHYSGSQKVNAGDNNIPVNTSAMSDGIYFVRMNIDGELFTQKIIKR